MVYQIFRFDPMKAIGEDNYLCITPKLTRGLRLEYMLDIEFKWNGISHFEYQH